MIKLRLRKADIEFSARVVLFLLVLRNHVLVANWPMIFNFFEDDSAVKNQEKHMHLSKMI